MMNDVDLDRCRSLFSHHLEDDGLEHDEYFYELLMDYVTDHGIRVFLLEWDSGGPGGGAGTESVHSFQDFFFTSSVDFGWAGPFDALEDALQHLGFLGKEGLIRINEATREIRCIAWTEEQLIRRLDLETFDLPESLVLNQKVWRAEELRVEREDLVDDGGGKSGQGSL